VLVAAIYPGPESAADELREAQVPGGDARLASKPATRQHQRSGPGAADLAAVAIGGGVGSVARYLLSAAFPAGHGFPWAIFAVNVSGCFVLGLLMVYLLEVWPPRRLLRPLLAIGLIGGYTTFSTYAAGVLALLTGHAPALAAAYALTSIVAALAAVWCGMKGARTAAGLPGRIRTRHIGGDE
jgi:fluoride exporter